MSSLTLIINCAEQLILEHLLHFLYGFIIQGLLRGPFVGRFFCDFSDTRLEPTFYILEGGAADTCFNIQL